jgi:septum formation protein
MAHASRQELLDRLSDEIIVLASASPRRRELLGRAGIAHEVMPADIDERPLAGESPAGMVVRLAREKALVVATRLAPQPPRWVLAADTIVVLDSEVLGKPDDAEHAHRMLRRLTGRRHRVVSGVALVRTGLDHVWPLAVTSEVTMRTATEAEIRAYVATGEPLDKAGSYGIQGEGGRRFVTDVEGSETNVMGLPLDETRELLDRARRELPELELARERQATA